MLKPKFTLDKLLMLPEMVQIMKDDPELKILLDVDSSGYHIIKNLYCA